MRDNCSVAFKAEDVLYTPFQQHVYGLDGWGYSMAQGMDDDDG
jgi:hypothetical protein